MAGLCWKSIRRVGLDFPSLVSSLTRCIPIVQCTGLTRSRGSSRYQSISTSLYARITDTGMKHIKTISIDQLKLGMFIVGMDQPWYRTPFLLHKRLIRHAKDIDLLKQHGIREVKIDSSRGLDVEPVPAGNLNPASHIHNASASPETILDVPQASSDEPCRPASDGEKYQSNRCRLAHSKTCRMPRKQSLSFSHTILRNRSRWRRFLCLSDPVKRRTQPSRCRLAYSTIG